MRGRVRQLTVLTALLGAILSPTVAHAHRLDAEAQARLFGLVQVESWFETGQKPFGARVEVFSTDGRLLAEGKLEAGRWVVALPGTEALRVVVSAGGGHRAEASVTARERANYATATRDFQTWLACATPIPCPFVAAPLLTPVELAAPLDLPSRPPQTHGGIQWQNLGLGVSLLGSLALVFKIRQWARQRPLPATGTQHTFPRDPG